MKNGSSEVPYREDRDVKKLIAKHKDEIDKLKKQAQKVAGFNPKEHDDIFLLRYILSHGTAKKALPNVEFTIEYRTNPENKYYLDMMKNNGIFEFGVFPKLVELGLSMSQFHCKPAKDGGPVMLVRQPRVNMATLLDIWTHDEMVLMNNLQKEHAFLECDRVTRETGRLTKFTLVTDFRGMKFQRPDNRIMNSFSESSKLAEKIYPQLVETTVLTNAPSWSSWVIKLCRLFISKRTMEKFRLCTADSRAGDATQCPYLKERFDMDAVPTFLGGNCECEKGCIWGLSNDDDHELQPTEEQMAELREYIEKVRAEQKAGLEKVLG